MHQDFNIQIICYKVSQWNNFWKTSEILRIVFALKTASPKCALHPDWTTWLTAADKRHKAMKNFITAYGPRNAGEHLATWKLPEPGVWLNPQSHVKADESHRSKSSPNSELVIILDIQSWIPATYTFKIQQQTIKRRFYTKKVYSSWQSCKCSITKITDMYHGILWLQLPTLYLSSCLSPTYFSPITTPYPYRQPSCPLVIIQVYKYHLKRPVHLDCFGSTGALVPCFLTSTWSLTWWWFPFLESNFLNYYSDLNHL